MAKQSKEELMASYPAYRQSQDEYLEDTRRFAKTEKHQEHYLTLLRIRALEEKYMQSFDDELLEEMEAVRMLADFQWEMLA